MTSDVHMFYCSSSVQLHLCVDSCVDSKEVLLGWYSVIWFELYCFFVNENFIVFLLILTALEVRCSVVVQGPRAVVCFSASHNANFGCKLDSGRWSDCKPACTQSCAIRSVLCGLH